MLNSASKRLSVFAYFSSCLPFSLWHLPLLLYLHCVGIGPVVPKDEVETHMR